MNQGSMESSSQVHRIQYKRRGLHVDLPSDLFQTAFGKFTIAAERFALSLTDALHQRFAHRYLVYLQEMAQGAQPQRPSPIFLPACTLIRNELHRLFQNHFCQPAEKIGS
jgi:hypothetical protein